MMNNMGLGFVFTAHDLASAKMQGLERNFMSLDRKVGLGSDRIAGSFREFGIGLSVMTAGAVMVGGAFALASKAGEFEQAIAAVAAVSGATRDELAQLHDAAIDAGIATQFTPTEATVGLRELAQAGFSASESIKLLIPVLDLAGGSLGELSPAQAAGLASQALKAFGISADQAAVSVDQMLQAVNAFALNASELPMALGNASRGAQALHQSLSETLITLGLVKNIIPGVERASTGVAVAMERIADPKVQTQLKGLGVSVTDSGGHFRNFLDVIGDMAPALDKMTDAKRAAFLIDTFGAHALGSVQAVLTQVTNGIRTSTGETVKGSEALAYLRKQFENAGGTAAGFREKMLDTFAGQKQLLRGSIETMAIVLGEPFAAVFKPILAVILDGLNGFLRFVRSMPASVKKGFAAFIVGAGAILTLIGAAIAAKAGIALLVIGLKAAGVTFGGLVAVLLPAILIVAAIGVAIAGLYVAFQKNLGGIADFAQRVWARVSLFFSGLKQLVEDGGFSGAVRDELNRAENRGLKDFLINVYLWANRVWNFLSGIAAGFSKGVDAAKPTIDAFLASLTKLGTALGFVSERDDAATATSKFEAFGATGARVGAVLATIFEFIVQVMTAAVDVARGVVEGWNMIAPAAMLVWNALVALGTKLAETIALLTGGSSAARGNGDTWSALGQVISFVVSVIIGGIALFISYVTSAVAWINAQIGMVISIFSGLADVVTGVVFIIGGIFSGSWSDIWTGMKLIAFGVIDAIIGVVLELVGAIAGAADSLLGLFGKTSNLQASVQGFKDKVHGELAKTMGVEGLTFRQAPAAKPLQVAVPPPPATAPMPAIAALPGQPVPGAPPVYGPPPPPSPVMVNLQLDGQTIATAIHKTQADNAARAFSPFPPISF
jgi:TP901 family phage tail tape measure protein